MIRLKNRELELFNQFGIHGKVYQQIHKFTGNDVPYYRYTLRPLVGSGKLAQSAFHPNSHEAAWDDLRLIINHKLAQNNGKPLKRYFWR